LLLLRHFYRADETPQMMAGIGNDWQAVLGGLPEWAVEEACTGYHLTEAGRAGRKPTPGMVYDLAARKVADLRREVDRLQKASPEKPRQRMTPEAAQAIIAAAGFRGAGAGFGQ
jgi:hypothetical protein